MLGNGKNRYQFLDVEDLCQAIYLTITGEDCKVNDVFNIGAERFDTMKEDYQAVMKTAGHGKRIICLPAAPILIFLRLFDKLGISPLYARLYEKLQMDYYVSIDKAKKQLGYAPRYSNQESFVRGYQWYKKNINSISHKTGNSNSVPWKQGVLKFGKIFF